MSIVRQRFSKNFFRYNSLGSGFNPTADFSITGPASVDEGAEADFNVRAFGLQTGSTLQWSVVDNSSNLNGRFDNTSGDVSILNNYNGAFAVTVDEDNTTANDPQNYTVGILWNNQLAATKTVTVNDTSQDPPAPSGNDFFWAGDQNFWIIDGGINANSTYSSPEPANPSFTYLDNSYTGKTRDFTGTEWMCSVNLSIGGAWQSNTITVDIWFYPTANNVQILEERNTQPGVNLYHYSMLEINSSGNVKAHYYNGTAITSTNAVILNRWNHIWFTEDSQGGHSFELNGVPTTGNPTYTRTKPTAEYFTIGYPSGTNMGSSAAFQGKVGYLNIHDYVVASTYSSSVNKFQIAYTATFGTNAPPEYTSTLLVWNNVIPQDLTGWTITGPEVPQGVTVATQTVIGGVQTQMTLSQPIHYLATTYTFVSP